MSVEILLDVRYRCRLG